MKMWHKVVSVGSVVYLKGESLDGFYRVFGATDKGLLIERVHCYEGVVAGGFDHDLDEEIW